MVTAEVLDGWNAARRTTPGGQSVYSELAIEAGMMLRRAFHLALRQTEGLMGSIFGLLGVPLSTQYLEPKGKDHGVKLQGLCPT